jgi:DNA-binding NtrC family response regulator
VHKQKKIEGSIPVLAMVPDEDHAKLKDVFGKGFKLGFARTLEEMRAKLAGNLVPVVLYEEGFADIGWKKVLEATQSGHSPPHLVVVHKYADARFWVEVLNLGGYDVLNKPYEIGELLRVITYAAKQWLGIP